MRRHLEPEAAEALRNTLCQSSVVKLKDICFESHGRLGKTLTARVEVSGHAHILLCKVAASSDVGQLEQTFIDLRRVHERFRGEATPVLIAPEFSEEAQALCRESKTGFIDLDGNARLYLDDVFIVKRSLPNGKTIPPPAETLPTSETAHFAHVA
jgi:16S rRNA C1402 (ribose-2'-O) methylase RsmI